MINQSEDIRQYRVVINVEEQYSIWLEYKDITPGWSDIGIVGSREECLSYIEKHWTDMRPLSLRKKMNAV